MSQASVPPTSSLTAAQPAADQTSAYDLPQTPRELAATLGVPVERIVKLDANEGVYGPPAAALAALADFAARGADIGRYPDASAGDLRRSLASYTGVSAERIVVGNGSDELIELLVGLLAGPGDDVIVCEPTFALYGIAARRHGASVVAVPLQADFTVRANDVLAAITPRTRLIFLCGPNNPTGTPLAPSVVESLLDRGPLVVVDEAYHEFVRAGTAEGGSDAPVGASPATELLVSGRSLVVLRTFSKAFGLASLRVGYALCPPDLANRLRARKAPYNVNAAGQAAAHAALGEVGWVVDRAAATVRERERLATRIAELPGMRVYPSAANFLLVEWVPPAGAKNSLPLWRGLGARGILVRRFEHPRLEAALRVTVGTPAQNDALVAALADVLAAANEHSTAVTGEPAAPAAGADAANTNARDKEQSDGYIDERRSRETGPRRAVGRGRGEWFGH